LVPPSSVASSPQQKAGKAFGDADLRLPPLARRVVCLMDVFAQAMRVVRAKCGPWAKRAVLALALCGLPLALGFSAPPPPPPPQNRFAVFQGEREERRLLRWHRALTRSLGSDDTVRGLPSASWDLVSLNRCPETPAGTLRRGQPGVRAGAVLAGQDQPLPAHHAEARGWVP
jgi:hypothetical protein